MKSVGQRLRVCLKFQRLQHCDDRRCNCDGDIVNLTGHKISQGDKLLGVSAEDILVSVNWEDLTQM